MKARITLQERLKDLRVEKGLSITQLSEKTDISSSALGEYENDENKGIPHFVLVKLADFYGVSLDYLFDRTVVRENTNTDIAKIQLDDKAIDLLKSGKINNMLLNEMKREFKVLAIVLYMMFLCIFLGACGNSENAYFKGQYLYMDGTEYVEATGLYKESNTIIGKTGDDYTIYEVDGDSEHNYIVLRSFFDQTLYVRKNYIKDKTVIEALCFNQNKSKFVYDESFIDIFIKELLEDESTVEIDNKSLMSYRKTGIDVYVKYANDSVSEYCGSIIYDGSKYLYFNAQNSTTILVNEKTKNMLAELEILKK